jgi:hypothetical protein
VESSNLSTTPDGSKRSSKELRNSIKSDSHESKRNSKILEESVISDSLSEQSSYNGKITTEPLEDSNHISSEVSQTLPSAITQNPFGADSAYSSPLNDLDAKKTEDATKPVEATNEYTKPSELKIERAKYPLERSTASSSIISLGPSRSGTRMLTSNPISRPISIINHSASEAASLDYTGALPKAISSESWKDRVAPEVVAGMSKMEQKTQTTIWELIITERDYTRDIAIIIDVNMLLR